MSRKKYIFIGLLLIAFPGISQKLEKISADTAVIGKNLDTGKSIHAEKIVFPERIFRFHLDTINQHISFQLRDLNSFGNLRNRGHLLRYDIEKNKMLWANKVSYTYERIWQFGSILLDTYGGWTYRLDNETGEHKWQNKKKSVFC